MKNNNEPKIVYYKDLLNDEFSSAKITPKPIGDNYNYLGGFGRKIARIFVYHILARPIALAYLKLHYGHKIIGKEKLKHNKGGYYMYGNHTNPVADALIPSIVNMRKGTYVIVHPNNVSMPVLGRITPALGALPLPDTMKAMKNFNKALKTVIEKKQCVMIYPEAHIWPYCTFIRPFKSMSFGYPISGDCATFAITNTYVKRRFFKTPRIVTYIDGPFFPTDKTKSIKEQKEDLRNQVYDTMVNRSDGNTAFLVQYVPSDN